MGIYDRHYYREPSRSGVGSMRMWSVTTWLIILNVAVFVLEAFLRSSALQHSYAIGVPVTDQQLRPLFYAGFFSIDTALLKMQLWRVITCQFLHAGLWHLLMNMIGLWMFGPVVELNLGSRRYAFFYLLCGIAGPVMYTVLCSLQTLSVNTPEFLVPRFSTPLVGASAGIFGVLLAAAYLAPDRLVYVYFFELPLKYFAWIMMAIAAYTVLVQGPNAGGQAAHLGGGLLGVMLIRAEGVLDIVAKKRVIRGRKVKDWSRDMNR
jgi:membrane associated rhomboid family serine protease